MLFDEYAHAVYNLGFRLTADWSAAEEVVSLAFLEAWRLRDRLDLAVSRCGRGAGHRGERVPQPRPGVPPPPGGDEQAATAATGTGFR